MIGFKFNFNWIGDKYKSKRFDRTQQYIDEACIDLMTDFVPVGLSRYKKSGKLKDSVKNPKPGVIVYTAPFARFTYYDDTVDHTNGGNPHGTRLWFETMKKQYAKKILYGAVKRF